MSKDSVTPSMRVPPPPRFMAPSQSFLISVWRKSLDIAIDLSALVFIGHALELNAVQGLEVLLG